MSTRGFFSIIQYCPDLDRAEGANLGVVLCVPEASYLDVRMSDHNGHIKRRFGAESFDGLRLDTAKAGFLHRLKAEVSCAAGPSSLIEFAGKLGNHLILTPPRTIIVREQPQVTLERLYERLASPAPQRPKAKRSRKPKLKELLVPRLRLLGAKFDNDVPVTIPNYDTFQVPIAYTNGARHLVTAEGFPASPAAADHKACEVAVMGRLLSKHPEPDGTKRRLIVVADFSAVTNAEVRERVEFVLHECDTRLVDVASLDEFADEISQVAH